MRRTKPPIQRRHRNQIAKTRPHAIHKPNKDRVKHGIPRWLRQFCKRMGNGIADLVSMHKKFPAEKL